MVRLAGLLYVAYAIFIAATAHAWADPWMLAIVYPVALAILVTGILQAAGRVY